MLQACVAGPVSLLHAVLAASPAGLNLHPHLLDPRTHCVLILAAVYSALLKGESLYQKHTIEKSYQ